MDCKLRLQQSSTIDQRWTLNQTPESTSSLPKNRMALNKPINPPEFFLTYSQGLEMVRIKKKKKRNGTYLPLYIIHLYVMVYIDTYLLLGEKNEEIHVLCLAHSNNH